ncbi:MAG: helix-turn-helix domain-containing protein [Candidatus Binataceae bacterium]
MSSKSKHSPATCSGQAESCGSRQIGAQVADTQECLSSVEEASRRLSVSTFTTRRLIKSKQLRAVRVGKRVLVPQSEIERVIAKGCGKHAGDV